MRWLFQTAKSRYCYERMASGRSVGVSQGDSPRDSYEDLKQQRGHEGIC